MISCLSDRMTVMTAVLVQKLGIVMPYIISKGNLKIFACFSLESKTSILFICVVECGEIKCVM